MSSQAAQARSPFRHRLGIALAYVGLLQLDGALGPESLAFDHTLGLVVVLLALAALWPVQARLLQVPGPIEVTPAPPKARRWSSWLLLACAVVVLAASDSRSAWLFGAAAAAAGLARAELDAARARTLAALSRAALVFAGVRLVIESSSGAFRVVSSGVESASRAIGAVLGTELHFGPTAAGLSHFVLFALMLNELAPRRADASRVSRFGLSCGLPLLMQAGSLACAALRMRHADEIASSGGNLAAALLFPALLWRAAIEALLLAVLVDARGWLGLSSADASPLPSSVPVAASARTRFAVVSAAFALGLAVFVASAAWEARAVHAARPGRFVALGDVQNEYRNLLQRARSLGFDVSMVEHVHDAHPPIGPGDVVAIVFPPPPGIAADVPELLDAVERGAGLLVTGDHTNARRCSDLLRPLLAPLGMGLRFDSVFPFAPWHKAGDSAQHALAASWRGRASNRYLVGASLDVPWSGRVLFSGRYAFGDRGALDSLPENFIGDRVYGPRDTLCDRPVVATRAFGAGRVVLMGDSEAILDENLAGFAPCLTGMLAYLCAPSNGLALAEWGRVVGALLVLAAGACASRRAWIGVEALLAAFALTVLADPRVARAPFEARGRDAESISIALVHQPSLSLDERSPQAIERLVVALEEQGRAVDFVDALDARALSGSGALILVAPRSPLDERETASLLEFARAGGLVVAATNWRHKSALDALLRAASVDVSPTLAARGVDADPEVREKPEVFREPYALHAIAGATVRALHRDEEGLMLVSETDCGKGRIVVIGDPLFLLGGNLGGEGLAFEANLELLQRIVEGS